VTEGSTGAAPDDARWPVSVKGVILDGDRVVLLRNERDEWELPGGDRRHRHPRVQRREDRWLAALVRAQGVRAHVPHSLSDEGS